MGSPVCAKPADRHAFRDAFAAVELLKAPIYLCAHRLKFLPADLVAFVQQAQSLPNDLAGGVVETYADLFIYEFLKFRGKRNIYSKRTTSDAEGCQSLLFLFMSGP
jgi:hypothetical protein